MSGKRILCVILEHRIGSRSLSNIPGPRNFPLIGTLWTYLPIIGDYDLRRLDEVGRKKHERYGDLVFENMAGVATVSVRRPEDIASVFAAEGRYPCRRSHLALAAYRRERPHLYNSPGLFPSIGTEWWKLRQAFQQPVSPLQEARLFLPVVDEITKDFVNNSIKSGEIINDFLPLVSILNLELTWSALFGEKLRNATFPEALVDAAENCNQVVLATDNTHFIWKFFKTPTYKFFEKNMELIERVALESIEEFKMKSEKRPCIVSKFLDIPGMDEKDVLGMVVDLLLGGVDTTSYTSCFLLYCLAKNLHCQERLHREAVDLLPDPESPITAKVLGKASFSRAVLKETMRLHPISVGTSRFLNEDAILAGHLVPKGTLVMTQNMVACRREENFTRAAEFLPERWEDRSFKPHPHLLLPFGHGPRACIARRRAEQNLLVFIIRVSRMYKVEWKGDGELNVITPLINKPDRPTALLFTNI